MEAGDVEKSEKVMTDFAALSKDLELGLNVHTSLQKLCKMEAPLATWHKYSIPLLIRKYLNWSNHAAIVRILMTKIRKLEDQSNNNKESGEPTPRLFQPRRKRLQPQPQVAEIQKPPVSMFKIPRINLMLKKKADGKQTPPLLDVSKMQNLPESEYDRVRPTLIHLSAKQLKSFMDRNPEIEKIADGLFRRHCQMDCPEEVSKKVPSEKWRTLHDVHINWKEYEETKIWESKLKERLKREEAQLRASSSS